MQACSHAPTTSCDNHNRIPLDHSACWLVATSPFAATSTTASSSLDLHPDPRQCRRIGAVPGVPSLTWLTLDPFRVIDSLPRGPGGYLITPSIGIGAALCSHRTTLSCGWRSWRPARPPPRPGDGMILISRAFFGGCSWKVGDAEHAKLIGVYNVVCQA